MKKLWIAIPIVVLLCSPLIVQAQDKSVDAEQQKAMEAYMKMGAVTENHEFMKNFTGMWEVQTTAWMAPGQPPAITQNACQADLRFGGRYLAMSFQGTMFGQPFEGLQIIGYDNLQKKYTIFWIDNTSTIFYLSSGTREGNVISESGSWPDPLTGEQVPVKAKTTLISADEFLFEQFMVMPDGKEFKSMENRCRRKK